MSLGPLPPVKFDPAWHEWFSRVLTVVRGLTSRVDDLADQTANAIFYDGENTLPAADASQLYNLPDENPTRQIFAPVNTSPDSVVGSWTTALTFTGKALTSTNGKWHIEFSAEILVEKIASISSSISIGVFFDSDASPTLEVPLGTALDDLSSEHMINPTRFLSVDAPDSGEHDITIKLERSGSGVITTVKTASGRLSEVIESA